MARRPFYTTLYFVTVSALFAWMSVADMTAIVCSTDQTVCAGDPVFALIDGALVYGKAMRIGTDGKIQFLPANTKYTKASKLVGREQIASTRATACFKIEGETSFCPGQGTTRADHGNGIVLGVFPKGDLVVSEQGKTLSLKYSQLQARPTTSEDLQNFQGVLKQFSYLATLIKLEPAAACEQPSQAGLIVPTREAVRRSAEPPQIYLLGDTNHFDTNIRASIANALSEFKSADKNFDCLFLEIDRRYQPYLDQYAAEEQPNYALSAKRLKKVSEAAITLGVITESFLTKAKASGVKVIAADIDGSSALGKQIDQASTESIQDLLSLTKQQHYDQLALNIRNQQFVELIIQMFASNFCHRGIFVIGEGHLLKEKTRSGVDVSPLQSLFAEKGVQAKRVRLKYYYGPYEPIVAKTGTLARLLAPNDEAAFELLMVR